MKLWYILLLAMSASVLMNCRQDNSVDAKLGEIDFAVSGKAEAQPYFEKGLLLLHSFEFDDAADEFAKAKAIDPGFALAYWGEAMTHNHPLWRYQDKNKADSILQLLARTPEERLTKAPTELEKDFIKGADILYGEGSKAARDSNYAAYMGELYQKYPGNNEVAAFYGLALIGSVQIGRNIEIYERAAEIAKEVLTRNPEHPGALHYLIHAYDDPGHAALALDAADAYAVIAPDAGHALHMPSHIYLASGMWDKVISSNEDAWSAGEARKERKHLTNDDLNYHAFHWLEYGYLQVGRLEDARRLVDEMQTYYSELPSDRAKEHLLYMKTTYVVETGDYDGDIMAITVDASDLNVVSRAMQQYIEAMHAFHSVDAAAMDSLLARMDAERLRDEESVSGGTARMCAGSSASTANALDIQQAETMALEVKAMRAWLEKDADTAENYLKQAVDLESSISYAYGPPSVVKPSWELYGEWLLENGRPEEALAQFEHALKVYPGRRLAEEGRERAKDESKVL